MDNSDYEITQLIDVFNTMYQSGCLSGRRGLSRVSIEKLANYLDIDYNRRINKESLCNLIINKLNENPLRNISPTALTAERELIHKQNVKYIFKILTEKIRDVQNPNGRIIDSDFDKVLIEMYFYIDKYDFTKEENQIIKGIIIDLIDQLKTHGKFNDLYNMSIFCEIILMNPLSNMMLKSGASLLYSDFYKNSRYYRPPINVPEEDRDDLLEYNISDDYIQENIEYNEKQCSNDNFITLEPYTKEDDPIQIYILNSKNKFEKSSCFTIEEFTEILKADKGTKIPSNIQSIYKCNRDCEDNGKGAVATGKLVVKVPPNNIFITLGSANKMLKLNNRIWYALPLYNGKRRRIGNLDELFASSTNHGQIPGFVVYKLYTKEQLKENKTVKESHLDFPIFIYDNIKELHQILGSEVSISFVNGIIETLIDN